jgi:hypothetical protein
MKLIDAADIIRAEANKRDAFVAAADALFQLGSLEQATNEALAAKAKAVDEAATAAIKRDIAESDLAAVKEKATIILATAQVNGESLIAYAREQAAALVSEANSKADYKTSELAKLNESVAAAKDELAVVGTQLESLNKQVAQALVDYQKLVNAKAALA